MVGEGNTLYEDKGKGCSPNLCWRLPLSQKAKKKTTDAQGKSDEVAACQIEVEVKDDKGMLETEENPSRHANGVCSLFEKMEVDIIKDPILQPVTSDIAKRCADLPDVIVRLFKNVDTLEEARNRLHALAKDIKDSCLLIEDEKLWVAVHDTVREAAVSFRGQKVFSLKAHSELKKWPERDHLHKCQEIYLPWCYMDYLPDKLESSELQTLALENQNSSYMQIPDSFFEETRELKVLDISGMHCTPKPPKSLGFLKNLTALCLFYCLLEDIAIVGELKNLQILNLSKSNIQELPREIGQLHQLRLLDLDRCSNLKVIPPKVISSLKRLEELYMRSGFVNWDIEGNTNASLRELGDLQYLISIDLPVPDAQLWPVDLFLAKLERFRIFVGDRSWDGNYDSKRLKLKLNRTLQSDDGVKMLL
ncbi:hypothetical protein L6164_000741 [Bauhinia variegata]|uniref:Uncharacterized protein n=1 Tax=Bauhinia variegata TaxID=167791 RepID=A0ACB9Q7P3_BAUVA|nr:hypothetical protein L6164_000741 [Bauhinia variegata]